MKDRLIEWFEDSMVESNRIYIDDIKEESAFSDEYETRLEEEMADAECETEEDYLEYLNNNYDDAIEWYVENFGAENFGRACLVALGYKTWSDFRYDNLRYR